MESTEGFATQVMLCWPADRAEIERLNATVGNPRHQFAPTIEHTLSTCDGCARSIWIGRQQLQLVDSAFVRAKKLCMFCAGTATSTLNLNPREVDIAIGQPRPTRRIS